jgi:glycine cleavage system H lipoate-binding protein
MSPAYLIFMGVFYTVLVVVATTVVSAAVRARRDLRGSRADEIRWRSGFEDLPARDRVCRHVLTGEFTRRECPNAFDCRLCETHAKLIARHPVAQTAGAEEDILGMSFPLDRLYHRSHTWAKPEVDGTVTVGLDELGWRLLGTPDAMKLPDRGTCVHANGIAIRASKGGTEVRLVSPVDGEVLETGGPQRGWLLKIRPPSSGEPAFRHLLRGAEIHPWLMREMERLQLALSSGGSALTLADGGVPVADMAAACPEADWDAVCEEMFLEC